MDLHQRMIELSTLDCTVARRFKGRPLLTEVAAALLTEQWQHYSLPHTYDPVLLYLVSSGANRAPAWVRPLFTVLIERLCLDDTLNLTTGEDFISLHGNDDLAGAVKLDLHEVQALVNDTGPWLLDRYRADLVEYWSSFDSSGQTPWHWYSQHLRKQFDAALDSHRQPGAFSAAQISVAEHLRAAPGSAGGQRPEVAVNGLHTDLSASGNIDVDLGSALLIERRARADAPAVTLLYTLAGKLLALPSRQTLLSVIGRLWPQTRVPVPREVHIAPIGEAPFASQALGLLSQQLRVADLFASEYHLQEHAPLLVQDLSRLTSMVELCDRRERSQRKRVGEKLPDWLKQASPTDQRDYASMLIDSARTYQDNDGKGWLDGIDTAPAFANRALKQRFDLDHPGNALRPEDVLVRNIQVIQANIGGEGLGAQGEERLLEYSLAELAIGNLGLLKSSRTVLISRTIAALPSWMNEAYLRTLVTELDIASAYPRMLRARLLEDSAQRQARVKLLGEQLRDQLPAMAMEHRLRGGAISEASIARLRQMLSAHTQDAGHWVLRPLGLLRRSDATPDYPSNTWLIEPAEPQASPCLLYRPLADQPLLEFGDRLALFVALSTPGALQDDLLQRLPAEDRKVYAHGGFNEPHLFYPLDDTFAVPFGKPAPATLNVAPAVEDIGQAIYQATVEESIKRFQAHASTTAETRWNGYKTLGWLLFNTFLPLAGSTLGKVAWLAQIEIALAELVEIDGERDPEGKRNALVNLLLDIALLLLSHAAWKSPLEEGPEVSLAHLPSTSAASLLAPPPSVNTVAATAGLEFSWSAPTRTLAPTQRAALNSLVATTAPADLGVPVPSGPLAGLYMAHDLCWARVQGKVYKVLLDVANDQPRIVSDTDEGALGPWLQRDEAGRWEIDLRLRLRGGMPKPSRIEQMKAANRQKAIQLNQQLAADLAEGMQQMQRLKLDLDGLAAGITDARLHEMLQQAQAISAHWRQHLERLVERNKLSEPSYPATLTKDYKVNVARALHQRALSEQMIHKTLRELYTPKRKQLSEFLERTQARITRADLEVYRQRLDTLSPLIDEIIVNADTLETLQQEMTKLQSRRQSEIQALCANLGPLWPAAGYPDMCREMRLENNFNRLFAQYPEVESQTSGNAFWLDLANRNIERVTRQRRYMSTLGGLPDEIAIRLLRRMETWLAEAERQLHNVQPGAGQEASHGALEQIREDAGRLRDTLRRERLALPDYPPTQPLAQLRETVPQLVEDDELGLLLDNTHSAPEGAAQPEPVEASSVTEEARPQASLAQPLKLASPPKPSLKHLLKESRALTHQARAALAQFESNVVRFKPVEIRDLLMQEQRRLAEHLEMIQQRLTEDNQTDQSAAGIDAAQSTQALTDMILTLEREATVLRTRAALQQKPTVGNVLYLLELGEVTLHREGSRKQLAKVKGRPADYLDEYAIRHQGQDWWYAHFHYAAADTPKPLFLAGHLKTVAQRYARGNTTVDPVTGAQVEVYRYEITDKHVAARFFAVVA